MATHRHYCLVREIWRAGDATLMFSVPMQAIHIPHNSKNDLHANSRVKHKVSLQKCGITSVTIQKDLRQNAGVALTPAKRCRAAISAITHGSSNIFDETANLYSATYSRVSIWGSEVMCTAFRCVVMTRMHDSGGSSTAYGCWNRDHSNLVSYSCLCLQYRCCTTNEELLRYQCRTCSSYSVNNQI